MTPFMAAGRYANYLGDDESTDIAAAAYGANYSRLQRVKMKYDPENFFRINQNIPPDAPRVAYLVRRDRTAFQWVQLALSSGRLA